MIENSRRASDFTSLVALVVTELRGLNFEFEAEDDAARRIIEIVANGLREPNINFVG